jgi:hypothetical protein
MDREKMAIDGNGASAKSSNDRAPSVSERPGECRADLEVLARDKTFVEKTRHPEAVSSLADTGTLFGLRRNTALANSRSRSRPIAVALRQRRDAMGTLGKLGTGRLLRVSFPAPRVATLTAGVGGLVLGSAGSCASFRARPELG